jgi:hypothetical protein
MQYYDKQEISKKFLAEQAEKAQLLLTNTQLVIMLEWTYWNRIMTFTITHTKCHVLLFCLKQ